jgi:valyl-tRNA synthetase
LFTVPFSNLLLSKSSVYSYFTVVSMVVRYCTVGLLLFQETTKPVLKFPDTQAAVIACRTLLCCLGTALHALSPFMPFVAEELYHHLPHFKDHCCSESIMVAPYPTHQQVWLSGL